MKEYKNKGWMIMGKYLKSRLYTQGDFNSEIYSDNFIVSDADDANVRAY